MGGEGIGEGPGVWTRSGDQQSCFACTLCRRQLMAYGTHCRWSRAGGQGETVQTRHIELV